MIACHLALGWPVPQRIIDLTIEFRMLANRRCLPAGAASIGCLLGFGHRAALATAENNQRNENGVCFDAVGRLFNTLEGAFDLGLALLRGRYMVAVARMEAVGVPVDTQLIGQLSDGVENHALLRREQQSVFGWCIAVGAEANPRGIRNFPMQANGAEMLRLACCLATESGIKVCMSNHDALLIEAPLNELDETIAAARQIMAEASAMVLDGLALRTDVRTALAPERWTDRRGQAVEITGAGRED